MFLPQRVRRSEWRVLPDLQQWQRGHLPPLRQLHLRGFHDRQRQLPVHQ